MGKRWSEMSRYLRLLLGFVLLASLASHRADADIAPNPLTGGWPVSPYEEGTTDVRMVAEDVVVRIYADSIVTVGSFSMRNEGKTVEMVVGFPFPYEEDLISFRAFVDGEPVEVRGAEKQHSGESKTWTTYWKVWDTAFPRGRTCEIRVEYKAKPSESLNWFYRRESYGSVPTDVLETCRQATTIGNVHYTLETGEAWKGILDRCRVSFEFVGMSDANIRSYLPNDGVVTKNGIVWEYTEYEPRGWINLEYFPNLPAQQIPEVLLGVVERFPGNPQLASDVGRFCAAYLGRNDLQCEIYHSFLASWDKPIPQLMEYASGGRCRFNYQAEGGFFAVWSMASLLFKQYQTTGEVERGKDIAPTVSLMSGAIMDSLDTCSGLPENSGWLVREARALRDLCNKLITGSE